MLGLAHRGFSLNDYKQHILHTLWPHGSRSTLIGVQHIARNPEVIGYDEIVETAGVPVAQVAPAVSAVPERRAQAAVLLDIGFSKRIVNSMNPALRRMNVFARLPYPFRMHQPRGVTWRHSKRALECWITE
jgi:hypothetical protein